MCNLLWNQTHNTRNAHPVAPARAHMRPPARRTDTHARTHICTRASAHTHMQTHARTHAHTGAELRSPPARPPSRAVPLWEVRANPQPRARAQARVAPAGLVPLGLQGSQLREGLSAGKKELWGHVYPFVCRDTPLLLPAGRFQEQKLSAPNPGRVEFSSAPGLSRAGPVP